MSGAYNLLNIYAGTVSNGVKQTGAMHLRAYSGTNANLANGNYLALAGTLATLNCDTTIIDNQNLPAIGTDTRNCQELSPFLRLRVEARTHIIFITPAS